ncbi:CapA family protein [Adhaeribacter terreus]|uniref:CapA family protein n=1 Tax=Adhaeribacter terreus TaxID=529703 RepID=A0ABW0EAJ6_9BACT
MQQNSSGISSQPASAITLFLAGDVMPGRAIDQVLPNSVDPKLYEDYVKDAREYVKLAEKVNGPIPKPVPYNYVWGDAFAVWQKMQPDMKLINLETSVTTHPEPWPGKPVQYRMHPANIPVLTQAGIDFCSLANNHTLDWSRPGLLETLQTLRKAGLPFAGAGENIQEASKPVVLKVKQNRVLVFAYGSPGSGVPADWTATANRSGINFLPDLSENMVQQIKAEVRKVKQPGDVVVFSVHWGSNWGYDIPPVHRHFAHRLIEEAGVVLIHGHSSHHPRPLEIYKGKLILYGAGDLINDYEGIKSNDDFRGDLSLMYFPTLDPATGKLLSLKMVPMQMRSFRLHKALKEDAAWLAKVLQQESSRFGTRIVLEKDGTLSVQK